MAVLRRAMLADIRARRVARTSYPLLFVDEGVVMCCRSIARLDAGRVHTR